MTNFFRDLDDLYVRQDTKRRGEPREERLRREDCPILLEDIVDAWLSKTTNYQ
jgi:hypothetical protein